MIRHVNIGKMKQLNIRYEDIDYGKYSIVYLYDMY